MKCLRNFTFAGVVRFHIPLSEHSKMSEVGSYMEVERDQLFGQTATEQNGAVQYVFYYFQTSGTKFQLAMGTKEHLWSSYFKSVHHCDVI